MIYLIAINVHNNLNMHNRFTKGRPPGIVKSCRVMSSSLAAKQRPIERHAGEQKARLGAVHQGSVYTKSEGSCSIFFGPAHLA